MSSSRNQPLGQLLVEAGLISDRDLGRVLAQQRKDPRRLGELLVEGGYVSGARLTQLLSHQLKLPWISPENIYFDEAILALIPAELALQYCLIPVYLQRDSSGHRVLYVAMDDPLDEHALTACELASGASVRPLVGATDQLKRAILRQYYGQVTDPPPAPDLDDIEVPSDARGAMWAAASVRLADSILPSADEERCISSRPTLPGPLADVCLQETDEEPFSGRLTLPGEVPAELLASLQAQAPQSQVSPGPMVPTRFGSGDRSRGFTQALPVVLVAHAPRSLVELCRLVAAELPAQVEHAQLANLNQRARETGPIAIVVTEDVYAFDRVAFNRLAFEVNAPLVLWSDDLDVEYLEPLLATAFENSRSRR